MSGFRLADAADPGHVRQLLFAPSVQFLRHFLVEIRPEQLPEDQFFVIGFGAQKLHELALRDHGDLHELTLGKAHDLFELLVDLRRVSLLYSAVRERQHSGLLFVLKCVLRLSLERPHVAGRSADRVDLVLRAALLGESQLHIRLHRERGELALQLCAVFSVGTRAGLPVEGKDQRVEDGRLSGARIARDQEEILVRDRKVNISPLRVGAKSLHG